MNAPQLMGGTCRRAREFAGLTQMDVAVLADVSQSTVSRFERGQEIPSYMAAAIVNALDLTGEYPQAAAAPAKATIGTYLRHPAIAYPLGALAGVLAAINLTYLV